MLIPRPSYLSIRNCLRRHFHGNAKRENSPRNSRFRCGGGRLFTDQLISLEAEKTVMILRQFLAAWAFLTGGSQTDESSHTTITRIAEGRSPTYYTTRFDYVNVDSFLSNSRLVNSYLACIMDKGPCTKEGNELKVIIPDAIKTDCSKCTDRQRTGIEKVILYLSRHRKDQWKELLQRVDPEGKDRANYTLGAQDGYSPYT